MIVLILSMQDRDDELANRREQPTLRFGDPQHPEGRQDH
jgi:hypothetical protein